MAVSGSSFAAIVVVLLLDITCRATAQAVPPVDDDHFPDVTRISFFMAVFCPLFFILLFFACISMCRDPEAGSASTAGSDTTGSDRSRRSKKGMDAAAIAALRLVFYREVKEHRIKDGTTAALECAVCLLEFDDDDALRLLPTCPHVFHPVCIGLWLAGHVTCPLCRANLLEQPPVTQAQPVQETAAPVPAASPDHATVVVVDVDGGDREEERKKEEAVEFAWLVSMQRAERSLGPAVPRSNSTGHEHDAGHERFTLRLPEHVRIEILMSQKLRHVTSAVASVRVREGSCHGRTIAGIQNAALERLSPFVARVLSRLTPGRGGKGEEDDMLARKSEGSSRRRREGSAQRGGGGEGFKERERRSV